MMTQYIVLMGQIVGGGERPFETVYGFDGEKFKERAEAIRHGLRERGSDDFNIGVLERGKLVSLDWMEKPVETDPAELAAIRKKIAL